MKPKTILSLALLALSLAVPARAQIFTVQHTFTNSPDGSNPGLVAAMGGLIYGNTANGGTADFGTLFSLNPSSGGFTTFYNFTGGNDGGSPNDLLATNNVLYGTTLLGGTNNLGSVFSVNTNGTGFKTIYSFGAVTPDGLSPQGGLTLLGSTLYGTLSTGGIYSGTTNGGAVFKVGTDGSGYAILRWFTNSPDGYSPQGELVSDGSMLYGTTTGGGNDNGGIVFAVSVNGSSYSILHTFTNIPDGFNPYGGLALDQAGWLYGMTIRGGTNNTGTIYTVNTNGSGYKVLYNFGDFTTDGVYPKARLSISGPWIYGSTRSAGAGGGGTLFVINTNGTSFTVLHSFTNVDGANPSAGVVRVGNAVWGSTTSGGAASYGVLYSLLMPFIATQPQDVTVTNGTPASFAVTVTDDYPTTYQWYFNTNTLLSGATNDTLNLAATNLNAGAYTVVVTDTFGSITSSPAMLTVVSGVPTITLQPAGLTITNGASITFTSAAAGPGTLVYQWLFETNGLLTAATNTILVLSNANQPGMYSMKVTNIYGAATSSPAQLNVVGQPILVSATFDRLSGSYSFSYVNIAGSTNRLWASSNLTLPGAWIPIATNFMPTNALWYFTDTNSAKTNAVRFYRFSTP